MLDGVFTTSALDAVQFHQVASPTDAQVAHLVTSIRTRILRLLGRRGLGPEADVSRPDPVVEEFPVLAGLSSASVQGRVTLGPRAGTRLTALGRNQRRSGSALVDPGTPIWTASTSPLQIGGVRVSAEIDGCEAGSDRAC